jgi:hypothetical protein
MFTTAILLSSILFADSTPVNGGGCDWNSRIRTHKITAGGTIVVCNPQNTLDIEAPPNSVAPQNAFLIQPEDNAFDALGFRAKLSPLTSETVIVAQIAATVPQTAQGLYEVNPRYHTKLSPNREEILISVSGAFRGTPQLIFSYGEARSTTNGKNMVMLALSPLDVVDGVLEMDARLTYSSRFAGQLSVMVCTQRGAGNCYIYTPPIAAGTTFGSAAPDITLGYAMPPALPTLRARYCVLPAGGFTTACPAAMVPGLAF